MEDVCLAEYAALYERKPVKKKDSSKEIDIEIDETDNNVEKIMPGTTIILRDGYQLVRRKVPKIIGYVKFIVRKDPEMYYREELMLFSPFRDEINLMCSSSSYEEQYKGLHDDIKRM